ncbi:MAG: hypothetical protein HOV84_17520 [Streptomyces sp.]|nr:hypothetical protein [Streptomyces sp.]
MNLAEALNEALSKRYPWGEPKSPATSWRGLHARMGRLERALAQQGDSPSAARARAARAAGLGPSTWDFWRSKKRHPSAASLRKLEGAFARLVAGPHLAAAIRRKPLPTKAKVTAVVRWANSPKTMYNGGSKANGEPANLSKAHRTVKLDGLNLAGTVRAWANHGPEPAAQAFEAAVKARYKDDVQFEDRPGYGVRVEFLD